MTPEQIKEGRRLLEAATAGPWVQGRYGDGSMRAIVYASGDRSGERVCTIAEMCEDGGELADASAIVWLRNHAAELLDAAERIEHVSKSVDRLVVELSEVESERNELRAEVARNRCELASVAHERDTSNAAYDGARMRADKAERERDDLRAEVERLRIVEESVQLTLGTTDREALEDIAAELRHFTWLGKVRP